jgi:hypothetical protein
MNFDLTKVYNFFGGFAETITIIGLAAGITLAFLHRLTGDYAAMITAVGGSAIAHDQLTQWNNRRDHDGDNNHNDSK